MYMICTAGLSSGKDLGHMEDSRRLKRRRDGGKQEDRAAAGGGGGRGQGVWDGLINRVSDSTHFCPWDESTGAAQHQGIVGNKRLFSPVVFAHHHCHSPQPPQPPTKHTQPPKTSRRI